MGREGKHLFRDGVSKKEKQDEHLKSKAFTFLNVLQIAVKDCFQ